LSRSLSRFRSEGFSNLSVRVPQVHDSWILLLRPYGRCTSPVWFLSVAASSLPLHTVHMAGRAALSGGGGRAWTMRDVHGVPLMRGMFERARRFRVTFWDG
jgi:hypothetical protein